MRNANGIGHSLRLLLLQGLLAACAAISLLLPAAVAGESRIPGTIELEEGRFALGQYDGRFGDALQRWVSLPHAWSVTHPGATGDAWYTLDWKLDALPNAPQALCITAFTAPIEVYLNGELVGGSGPLGGRLPRSYEQSRYIDIPAGLLHLGTNYLGIHMRAPVPDVAGLGPVLAGDAPPLRERARKVLFIHTIGPAAISIATLTVGVFIFVLWLRRHERGYLLFALAVMLWSVQTLVSLLPEPLVPQPHWAVLWTSAYLLFAAMLSLFCIRFANVQWPMYERFAIGYAIATVPVLYTASAVHLLPEVASLARLGGIAMVVVALVAVTRYSLRRWNVETALLLAAGTVSAVFAVHDWLASQNPLALRPVWLLPYAALAFLTLFGYLLTDRFVHALNETERMNADLERRVEEKGAALSAQLRATQAARDAAEAANRAKSSFLAAASHDLRQPLHALGMFSQALAEQMHDADGYALVQRIRASVSALETLFSALLDVSKLDAGVVSAHPRDFRLRPLLDRLVDESMPEALERGLSLAVVCGDVVVHSDPMLLERILRNLVANALRYTRQGGVVIGCRRRGNAYSIEIWDSGVGIAHENLERIFEEFYQVGNPARDRSRGLGLGLAIVRRLAELLGHEVSVASRVQRGSVFRVRVPAGDPAHRDRSPAGDRLNELLANRRILVIDDEADVRESTARLLTQWGCDVVSVSDAQGAIRACRAAALPDAMIVDYRLGDGRDGLETIELLRTRFRHAIPAVLVSGASAVEELARIEASGILLLHKPVPPAQLRSVLTHLVDNATADAPLEMRHAAGA